ncbi:MAG: ECF transporter S component [Clostridiales bacterium]|nr:ECF transporter S component [Clostridiales bacterium]
MSKKGIDKELTLKIAYTGILTALIAGMTMLSIPVPGGGYVHVGDSLIFLAALILPMWYAVFAAGIGSAIADLIVPGAAIYAPATFIIKALMALIVCLLLRQSGKKKLFASAKPVLGQAAAFWAASLFMQAGYFVYELFLNDFHIAGGIAHILIGLLQTVFSVPLGLLLSRYLSPLIRIGANGKIGGTAYRDKRAGPEKIDMEKPDAAQKADDKDSL